MWDFSFENGMETSWCAELAFRTRVSMSAIGSVIVMGFSALFTAVSLLKRSDLRCRWIKRLGYYQELLVMPGSSPRCAISRRQTRHRPNLRYTECGRPQRWQRV